MRPYIRLHEIFHSSPEPSPDIGGTAVEAAVTEALDSTATKLDRIKALLHVAPQPDRRGMRLRLFTTLAAEDFALAAEIVLDAFWHGAFADEYLRDHMARILDPEQLRRAVGAVAACAREKFNADMLAQEDFAAIPAYGAAIEGMQRLIGMDYAVDEVRELAREIEASIRATSNTEYLRPEAMSRILGEIAALSRPFAQRPEPRSTRRVRQKPAEPGN